MWIFSFMLVVTPFAAIVQGNFVADYNSLEGGPVQVRWNIDDSDTVAEFFEMGSADLWPVKACGAASLFICVDLPGAPLAIPKDFSPRVRDARTCKEPSWKHGNREFRVVSTASHGPVVCGEPIPSQSLHLLGKAFTAYLIEVTAPDAPSAERHKGFLLWSPARGIVSFSRPSGVEYWLSSACGYGAPETCGVSF